MDPENRRAVLETLRENARYATADIARQTGLDPEEVEEHIEALEADGVIRGYQPVIDWGRLEDGHAQAEVDLNVELDRETSYDDIASRIAKFPEVEALRLVSGEYDFAVDIEAESVHAISAFVADRIAPIPAVTQTVTHFVMATYKERGIELDPDEEDDRRSIAP